MTGRTTHGGTETMFHSQHQILLVLLENVTDVLEDLRGEEVNSTVYDVTHERARLLHIMQHLQKSRWVL